MNKKIMKDIKDRKALYHEEGGVRTQGWKEKKTETDQLIKERKAGYMATQKDHLLADEANRNFFKHVINFSTAEKLKMFDVKELLLGKTDIEAAEQLGEYFNKVTNEFDPLDMSNDVPSTF